MQRFSDKNGSPLGAVVKIALSYWSIFWIRTFQELGNRHITQCWAGRPKAFEKVNLTGREKNALQFAAMGETSKGWQQFWNSKSGRLKPISQMPRQNCRLALRLKPLHELLLQAACLTWTRECLTALAAIFQSRLAKRKSVEIRSSYPQHLHARHWVVKMIAGADLTRHPYLDHSTGAFGGVEHF